MNYWVYQEQKKFNIDQAVQDFIIIFDFYLKNNIGDKSFNINYIQHNGKLKSAYGKIGKKLYINSLNNLRDQGGINKVVELASLQRPEILEYWTYQHKKAA